MTSADRSALPPVRLPSEDELAQLALASPLLSRAVELARWTASAAGEGIAVGPGGELLPEELKTAVARLGLEASPDGPAHAGEAWAFAVDAGLVVVVGEADGDEEEDEEETADADAATGFATPRPGLDDLDLKSGGDPATVLDLWSDGIDGVLDDAAFSGLDELPDDSVPEEDADDEDFDELEWDPEGESELLDSALGTLYLFTASDEEVAAGAMVPLPMVAAAVVMPEGEEEPSDEMLDDMSAVVMRLDEQFRALEGTGLLEYEAAEPSDLAGEAEDTEEMDLESFGRVRLTTLGLYGVRRRMVEAGLDAPVVGDLRHAEAAELLAAIPFRPEPAAREEAELWLAEHQPLDAVRQLLAAARGADPEAPGRRLGCQLVLSLVDGRGEEALREVLDDRELGGLARVWLAERGADDVTPPTEEMVFWLTVDTLAAQLGTPAEDDDADELRELVRDLTAQHSDFFDRAWRCEHPATADVLEAMGRLHPDRQLAKQARKAAFKARSAGAAG
ncbi:hypothetical protein [Streptomyces sp. 6N223]|uniref:hypothetical protein n=1 Tax=Streptomyces sp. 6N223 TaxID=3457412 RepID=UPI003FD2DCD0